MWVDWYNWFGVWMLLFILVVVLIGVFIGLGSIGFSVLVCVYIGGDLIKVYVLVFGSEFKVDFVKVLLLDIVIVFNIFVVCVLDVVLIYVIVYDFGMWG